MQSKIPISRTKSASKNAVKQASAGRLPIIRTKSPEQGGTHLPTCELWVLGRFWGYRAETTWLSWTNYEFQGGRTDKKEENHAINGPTDGLLNWILLYKWRWIRQIRPKTHSSPREPKDFLKTARKSNFLRRILHTISRRENKRGWT